MKVVFLLTQDLESPSGAGRYLPLAKGLQRLGHEITIAAPSADYAKLTAKETRIEGVRIRYAGQMHVLKRGSSKTYFPAWKLLTLSLGTTLRLARIAWQEKPDLVHIGKPHPMNSLAGLAVRFLRRCKLYLDCDDYEAESNRFSGTWQRKIVQYFEEWMPAWADRVTTNTYYSRDRLTAGGCPEAKIFYLSNGVDQDRFSLPDPQRIESLREQLGLQGKQVVSYIGSLSLANHRVDLLLQAFTQVQALHEQACLLITGGGEDIHQLKELAGRLGIARNTIFTGRVPPQEAALYYRISDVTVDPVVDDAAARGRSPLKLFEAWASGVPFISADVGDRRRLMGDPPAGWIVEPGSPHALAEAIIQALEKSSLADEMRRRGSERVCRYTWDVLARELSADYSSFMEQTR